MFSENNSLIEALMKFTKMHGLGNDFIVIHNEEVTHLPIKQLSDRHQGIGFDQLLLIGPSSRADFSCRIFNSDGSEAEQCGNGMRCVARFIHEEKLSLKNSLTIETKAGIVQATIKDYDHIEVNMGRPVIVKSVSGEESRQLLDPSPAKSMPGQAKNANAPQDDNRGCAGLPVTTLSLGNPHAIIQVSSLDSSPIHEWGPKISTDPSFPHGINVGFMEIIDRQHIRLRTYERGAGWTYACGSNACAAVVAGINNHSLDKKVNVELPLGNLTIEWQEKQSPVLMTGPASRVFNGLFIHHTP